jgi:hypothetical protein
MQDLDLRDSDYSGGLSPLTRYGTLNVSTARIPRKKRGKGNAHLRRDRVTSKGFAPTDEGMSLARQGVASVKVTLADGTTETRTVASFRKGRQTTRNYAKSAPVAKVSDCQRFAETIGYLGDN